MYKNPRRKSGRVHPYEIASSSVSTAHRNSAHFVSPIVDYDLSLSVVKRERTSLPSSIGFSSTTAPTTDHKMNKQADSIAESNNIHQTSNSQEQQKDRTPVTADEQLSTMKDDQSDKIETTKEDQFNKMETKINDDDDLFDSEIDKLLNTSNLEEKLAKQSEVCAADKPTDNRSGLDDAETYVRGEDDELFDSDAINNNEDCDSLQLDDIESKYIGNVNGFDFKGFLDGANPVGDKFDEVLKTDLPDETDEDDLDLELDSTLIFRRDDPIQSQYIITPVETIPEGEEGFRTAAGAPIQIKMSLEEQQRRARKLGLI